MRILYVLLFVGLTGCAAFDAALSPAPMRGGVVIVAGSPVLVPLDNSMLSFAEPMPAVLANRVRIGNVVAQSRGEAAGMQELCMTGDGTPDIVLLTRSPQMVEIRRCEASGVALSADLVALYRGGLAGAHEFEQVWIAYVPDRVARNRAAGRAVQALRYDFARLIEDTEYEPYFTARRN